MKGVTELLTSTLTRAGVSKREVQSKLSNCRGPLGPEEQKRKRRCQSLVRGPLRPLRNPPLPMLHWAPGASTSSNARCCCCRWSHMDQESTAHRGPLLTEAPARSQEEMHVLPSSQFPITCQYLPLIEPNRKATSKGIWGK